MSGNSTGDRVTRDDEEPVPIAGGLWLGEVTGLRLGDVPKEDGGKEKDVIFRKNMSSYSKWSVSERFMVQSHLLAWALHGR